MAELLVVIAIIAALLGLLLPIIRSARRASREAVCAAHLRLIEVGIVAYASDFDGAIPYGPTAPPATATNFYPGTGDVTSLISLENGNPVGLGLLLAKELAHSPDVLFCPGADQPLNVEAELARVGRAQAQGDYYYRHGSSVGLSDAVTPPTPKHIRLRDLGINTAGHPIRALALDQDYVADPSLAAFNVVTRTNHEGRFVNVLYADGHVSARDNAAGQYTIAPGPNPQRSLHLIRQAFETADGP